MMTYVESLLMLQCLRGAPLSCLVAMHIAGRPVDALWLSDATGYSPLTIRPAIIYLKHLNLVEDFGDRQYRLAFTSPAYLELAAAWFRRS